jgi:hypothetical protein
MSQHCLRCTVYFGHIAYISIVYSLKFPIKLLFEKAVFKFLIFFNSARLAVFPSVAMILQRQ